jgi:hypothetical protein
MAKKSPMQEAIDNVGGLTSLAALVDAEKLTKNHINGWRSRGRPPIAYAPIVERVSGVSRKRFFPNDWHRIWPELLTPVEVKP